MKSFRSIFTATIIFLLISCEESNTPVVGLPPATTTGEDTFGCYINGMPYSIFGSKFRERSLRADYTQQPSMFIQSGNRDWNGVDTDISILIESPLITGGFYPLKVVNLGDNPVRYEFGSTIYQTDDLVLGSVTLTRWDEEARIISGTFEFTMAKGADTVRVTEGRFDIGDVVF
ncbi:MAG: DUF6252 family protein [Bacteroidota bacterium]